MKNDNIGGPTIIDNFLAKDSADKVLDNFKINENWINVSFVNNYKKYQLIDKKVMDKNIQKTQIKVYTEIYIT